jgi:hypothetical protein
MKLNITLFTEPTLVYTTGLGITDVSQKWTAIFSTYANCLMTLLDMRFPEQ